MKILERNDGPKIPYSVDGTLLNLDNRMILNAEAYELDEENHLYLYQNRYGCLLCSADGSEDSESCYVAELFIPPRAYQSDRKAVYEGNLPVVKKTAVPFDMDRCTLALWSLE